MKNIKDRIEYIKANGYQLDFSTTFDRTINVYKKILVPAGLAFLIYGIFYSIIVSTFSAGAVDMSRIPPDSNWADMLKEITYQLENVPLRQQIIDGVVRIVLGILAVPLMAGIIQLCHDAETEKEISFGTVFRYYAGDHFSDLFVAAFTINLITSGIAMVGQFLIPDNFGLGFLFLMLTIVFSVLTTIVVPLIIFGNLGPIQAISASIAVVGKKFGLIMLLLFVTAIVAMLGLLACCIGVVFTLSLIPALQYCIYANSVGFDENDETSNLD